MAAPARILYSKAHVEPDGESVRVRIIPPKPGVLIGFLGVWWVFWTFGGLAAMGSMLRSGFGLATLFLLVWLVGWTVGETVVGALLAYLIAGEHLLTFTETGLLRQQRAFGVGLTWNYDAAHMSGLAAATTGDADHRRTAIRFDYGDTPVSVNVDLHPREADRVVAEVLERLPRYGQPTAG